MEFLTPPPASPLQAELARIEARAAEKSRQIIERQDDYLQALTLAALLKQHGAPEALNIHICYHSLLCQFLIYGAHTTPSAIRDAIAQAGLQVREIGPGYAAAIAKWTIEEYPVVELFMPIDLPIFGHPVAA